MINQRTDSLLKTYKPELAIMLYKADSDFYLESHSIDEEGRVLEGKPLLQETIQGMVDVLFDERQNMQRFTGLFPDNLMHFDLLPGGNYSMMWHAPAQKKVLHFAPQLKLPSEETWVPATLFYASGKTLRVYCLKTNARPTDKTKLHRAPYFNVNSDGSVCLGNARVKKPTDKTYISLIKYWEDLFWLSEFTHVNGSKIVKTDAQKVWRSLLTSKCKLKWSDIDEIVPTEVTIKKLMSR